MGCSGAAAKWLRRLVLLRSLGGVAERLRSLTVLSRLLSLPERLNDRRVIQYAEKLFDSLMLVRPVGLNVLGKDRPRFLQRFANSFVGVAHTCNLKARAVNPGETDWFSHYRGECGKPIIAANSEEKRCASPGHRADK